MTVDWNAPLFTNTGAVASLIEGPNPWGDYLVSADFGGVFGDEMVWFNRDGCSVSVLRRRHYVSNTPPVAAASRIYKAAGPIEPFDVVRSHREPAPDSNPKTPLLANLDAEIERLEKMLEALKGARKVLL